MIFRVQSFYSEGCVSVVNEWRILAGGEGGGVGVGHGNGGGGARDGALKVDFLWFLRDGISRSPPSVSITITAKRRWILSRFEVTHRSWWSPQGALFRALLHIRRAVAAGADTAVLVDFPTIVSASFRSISESIIAVFTGRMFRGAVSPPTSAVDFASFNKTATAPVY